MKSYRLLKDISTPWCVIKAGSICKQGLGGYVFDTVLESTHYNTPHFINSEHVKKTEWFEEIITNEKEYTEDDLRKAFEAATQTEPYRAVRVYKTFEDYLNQIKKK